MFTTGTYAYAASFPLMITSIRRGIRIISPKARERVIPLPIHLRRRYLTTSSCRQSQSELAEVPRGTIPLRILYCGSDHFSATSLKALHREHLANTNFIKSIDVVCKPPKNVGRGLKTLKDVPIKSVATELGLRIHEIDTFTNWEVNEYGVIFGDLASDIVEPPDNDPSDPINLIVVVSFGKLVPSRLLNSCLYGGINVHPSLLPMYRGAAPIYYTLLNGDPSTGVTVQTLHPQYFDCGEILAQSPEIPIAKGTTYQELHDKLAVMGAQLLVQTCRERLFAKPIRPLNPPYQPSLAPKIDQKIHSRLRWKDKSAEEIERYCGVLNSLWGRFGEPHELDRRKRVIFSLIEIWRGESDEDAEPGTWKMVTLEDGSEALLVKCKKGGGWVKVGGIKVEGRENRDGGEWGRSMILSGKESLRFS